jgi:photosystem II stability/assembly factor-like uncharacterized protein
MDAQINLSPHYVFCRLMHLILLVVFFSPAFVPKDLHAQHKLHDDLFAVSFADEKHGWACGRWGSVLHTSDGGKTWGRQDSGTDFTLASMYFVDSQNGWAVGAEGTILHTMDGGKIWESQKSPVPFFLMKVFFTTPLKGWIVTEQTHILSTVDGGKRWSIQFKDEDFILKSISFCDPLHGWTVGEYGYIYHTRDGGATWKKQAGHFGLSEKTGDVVGEPFLFDVVAVDPQRAWAVGIDGYLTKTVDAGRSWKRVETGVSKAPLYCVSSDKGGNILIGGKEVFLSSADNGRSWQNPRFEPPITYGWLYGLSRRGASGFVAVGWGGAIYLTSSNKWQQINY